MDRIDLFRIFTRVVSAQTSLVPRKYLAFLVQRFLPRFKSLRRMSVRGYCIELLEK